MVPIPTYNNLHLQSIPICNQKNELLRKFGLYNANRLVYYGLGQQSNKITYTATQFLLILPTLKVLFILVIFIIYFLNQ